MMNPVHPLQPDHPDPAYPSWRHGLVALALGTSLAIGACDSSDDAPPGDGGGGHAAHAGTGGGVAGTGGIGTGGTGIGGTETGGAGAVGGGASCPIDSARLSGAQVLVHRDYDTQDDSVVYREESSPGNYKVGDFDWNASQGYCSTGAYRLELNTWSGEDDTGWSSAQGAVPFGQWDHVFVAYVVKLSSALLDKFVAAEVGTKWQNGVFAWNAEGTDRSSDTRQVSFFRYMNPSAQRGGQPYTGGVGWVLVDGGAGYAWGLTGNEVEPAFAANPFDARDYADEWIYVVFEYDYQAAVTSLHIVTQDGVFDSPAGATPYLRRSSWDQLAPFEYGDSAHTLGVQAGYWNTLQLNHVAGISVSLDEMTITDRWIPAPF